MPVESVLMHTLYNTTPPHKALNISGAAKDLDGKKNYLEAALGIAEHLLDLISIEN